MPRTPSLPRSPQERPYRLQEPVGRLGRGPVAEAHGPVLVHTRRPLPIALGGGEGERVVAVLRRRPKLDDQASAMSRTGGTLVGHETRVTTPACTAAGMHADAKWL